VFAVARLSTAVSQKGISMIRCMAASVGVIGLVLLLGTAAFADARDDCRIVVENDGFQRPLAYVQNTNGNRRVIVTVTCTTSQPGQPTSRTDRVYRLGAGMRQFVGGANGPGNNQISIYAVTGATFE
jgi:hypothetical protein